MDPAVEIHGSAWDPIHNTADWVSKILTSRNLQKTDNILKNQEALDMFCGISFAIFSSLERFILPKLLYTSGPGKEKVVKETLVDEG
jgi:hypothetical protein